MIVKYLLDRLPTTQIVINGVLPRSVGNWDLPSVFSNSINQINTKLQ